MKLIQINDAHIRGSTPKSRIDEFPDALWQKFCELGEFIKDNSIDAILNGGDLFDTPDPSTGVVNRYLSLFSSWNLPIYSVVGSHDKFGYNDATISRTALGTLVAAGVVKIITKIPRHIGTNCSVAGISHSYSLDENPEIDYFIERKSNDYLVQLCHGMITEFPFYGKYTLYNQIRTEADLVICGHYHPGFGPFDVLGSTIVNIGSMGRVENVVRQYPPGFIYIDTEKINKWKFIPFKNVIPNPFINKIPVAPETLVDMSKFIKVLEEKMGNFEDTDIKELVVTLGKEKGVPLYIIEKALSYLEEEK